MRAIDNPPPWDAWARLARAALRPGPAIPLDELLLVRDLTGRFTRGFEPPTGVVPRLGAVLLLLYPDGDDLRLPLTVRSERLPSHRGEVSLPGGALEPGEDGPVSAALRECHEELGVEPESVVVWGTLSSLYIPPSNFRITPVVGFSADIPALRPNDSEVSAVLTVTLGELLDPALVVEEQWTLRGAEVRVPFFAIGGHKVWGATAVVLSEFVARMRRARAVTRDE
ncbi:MAG TPA: CoA pyrophosphatase [Roseiflexaceae bacterium]|nr:CoA pyrophosphatase [Roseiflexaceae bacterium]